MGIYIFEIIKDKGISYVIEKSESIYTQSIEHCEKQLELVKKPDEYSDKGKSQAKSYANRLGKFFNIVIEKTERPTETFFLYF